MPFNNKMKKTSIEIERKYLIAMPDMSVLSLQDGLRRLEIIQTYLNAEEGRNARVRKISENGKVCFIKTVKERISVLSAYEDEFEISEDAYTEELNNADTTKNDIVKTRYRFPFGNHLIEIDIYPFWSDRAILEVELTSEDEQFDIPAFIRVIKEVSDDKRYKNTNLAVSVPCEIIDV